MKDCLKEQKDIETQLHLADILLADKSIEELQNSIKDYETGLEQTILAKHAVVSDLKKFEVENRKLVNNEETVTRKLKNKKEELLGFQSAFMNKQKAVDISKAMILQKKTMLQNFQTEIEQMNEKKNHLMEAIQ